MPSALIRRGVHAIARSFVLASIGCFPFGAEDRHLDGPYRLFAADLPEQAMLCYDIGSGACVGRVAPTVFAVGWDARYVVAKRHPDNDRTRVEYFILDRAKDVASADPKVSTLGPYSESEYRAARQRLGVDPALDFRVVLRDLQ
jgi:hypothetical protein